MENNMKKKSSIKINYIYNILYQLSAIILPLITTPYISRVLNPNGIGIYSYALSNVTYFSMFATLGVSIYGQLQIAKNRDCKSQRSKLFWEIFIARCITTIVIMIFYGIFIAFNIQYKQMYIILSLNILGGLMDISWYLQGLELFKQTAIRNILVKILGAICIFVFVKEKDDLLIYAFILQGSYLIGNLILWRYLKNSIIKIPIKQLNVFMHWKNSIVYFIPSFATSIYTVLDKSMIGLFTNSEFQNGYYEQSYKIKQILLTIITSLGTVTMPRIVYLINNEKRTEARQIIKSANKFVVFLAAPMMCGLFIISPYLVPCFLGKGYEECVPILRTFSILMLVVGLDNTIGKQCLMATGKQYQFNKGVIGGALVNFITNICLIPLYGAIGAAIASVIAELVILIIFIYYARENIDIFDLVKSIIKYSSLSIIMVIIANSGAKVLAHSYLEMVIYQIIIAVSSYILLLIIIKDEMMEYTIKLIRKKRH